MKARGGCGAAGQCHGGLAACSGNMRCAGRGTTGRVRRIPTRPLWLSARMLQRQKHKVAGRAVAFLNTFYLPG